MDTREVFARAGVEPRGSSLSLLVHEAALGFMQFSHTFLCSTWWPFHRIRAA